MEQLTKNQAVATSQEAVQNQNEPQLRDENAHNDKSVHGVLNPTYQAGLRRDAVQPDIDRKSGSAGMPRPISYAVFCLKKKKERHRLEGESDIAQAASHRRRSTLRVNEKYRGAILL